MFKLLAAGAALSVLAASPTLAADLNAPINPTPDYSAAPAAYSSPSYDWTGFYAGVLGGYGAAQTTATNGSTTNIPTNGLLAGLTAGANMQMQQFVFGVEGDVNWSGQSGSTACSFAAGANCSADVDWGGTLRARAGYAIDPVLLYATGGLAVMQGSVGVSPATAGTSGTYKDTYYGWTVGAGIEAALTDTLSAKAEYDYASFGDRTAPAGTLAPTATTTSLTSHAVKIGLNYHF